MTTKYLPDDGSEPVILSQAAERERINEWWIRANIAVAVAVGMAVPCALIGIFMLMGARSRRAGS